MITSQFLDIPRWNSDGGDLTFHWKDLVGTKKWVNMSWLLEQLL